MIPNVCISWAQRKAQCQYCPEPVEAGTPLVTVFFWNKGQEDKRKWNVKQYFHPDCWVANGLDYLKMNPYVPYARSRKLPLTTKQNKKRVLILKRKAALDQRKRNLKSGYPDRVLVEARIDRQIAELMVQIASVGGIPPTWLV